MAEGQAFAGDTGRSMPERAKDRSGAAIPEFEGGFRQAAAAIIIDGPVQPWPMENNRRGKAKHRALSPIIEATTKLPASRGDKPSEN